MGTTRESWHVRNKHCKSKCWSVSAKFLSFPAESKNEDGGKKSKTCQKFFRVLNLVYIVLVTQRCPVFCQIK